MHRVELAAKSTAGVSGVEAVSPTLAANELIKRRIEAGDDIVHLAFGEAGLPVHPMLAEALSTAAFSSSYAPVGGDHSLRTSIAAYFDRRGLVTESSNVVVTPGCKAALFVLLLALPGDVVLPRPSWVSYEPQARLTKKRVIRVPIPSAAGGIPDPDALEEAIRDARDGGLDPRILIITRPDNPTGTISPRDLLERVCHIAQAEGLVVVSDEIYRDLAYEPQGFVSAAVVDNNNVILVGGLSKNLALGGWRIGLIRVPASGFGRSLMEAINAIGSEVWSCIPPPIAAAAQLAFDEPPAIRDYVDLSRKVHQLSSEAIFQAVIRAGVDCQRPQAAFYLYPDLDNFRTTLAARGIVTSQDLAEELLEGFGIAILPGVAFGESPDALKFRIATSLLYGTTRAEQLKTLAAPESAVQRFRRAGHRLEGALRALIGGETVAELASRSKQVGDDIRPFEK
jgi:aspartate aminotransferase